MWWGVSFIQHMQCGHTFHTVVYIRRDIFHTVLYVIWSLFHNLVYVMHLSFTLLFYVMLCIFNNGVYVVWVICHTYVTRDIFQTVVFSVLWLCSEGYLSHSIRNAGHLSNCNVYVMKRICHTEDHIRPVLSNDWYWTMITYIHVSTFQVRLLLILSKAYTTCYAFHF